MKVGVIEKEGVRCKDPLEDLEGVYQLVRKGVLTGFCMVCGMMGTLALWVVPNRLGRGETLPPQCPWCGEYAGTLLRATDRG